MKATRLMLLCEVRGLVVTRLDFDDTDGLSLDARILEAAGMVENEKVDVHVTSNGTRFACRVRASKTVGELAVTGASSYLLKPGDSVALSSFGWMKEKAALKHEPQVVVLGAENALPEKGKIAKIDDGAKKSKAS
ncbi:MAG: aspartate 1-decarboxylase [Archangium sp.]|nr:aspartate 1-decarboxylase [Archangium sp.]